MVIKCQDTGLKFYRHTCVHRFSTWSKWILTKLVQQYMKFWDRFDFGDQGHRVIPYIRWSFWLKKWNFLHSINNKCKTWYILRWKISPCVRCCHVCDVAVISTTVFVHRQIGSCPDLYDCRLSSPECPGQWIKRHHIQTLLLTLHTHPVQLLYTV